MKFNTAIYNAKFIIFDIHRIQIHRSNVITTYNVQSRASCYNIIYCHSLAPVTLIFVLIEAWDYTKIHDLIIRYGEIYLLYYNEIFVYRIE